MNGRATIEFRKELTMKQSESNELSRRRIFALAGLSAGAALLAPTALFPEGMESRSSTAQQQDAPALQPGGRARFSSLKQIDAGLLSVGYAEDGSPDGRAVILLHGWPYDIHSYIDVAPLLAAKGYRVIIPYLRGYGATQFLSGGTIRNGQQSVVAQDIIHLTDGLKIQKAILAGCDWGARTANIVAAVWPERCKALVSVSGYLIGSPETDKKPLPPKAELA
jgi:hypothetical protein